MHSPLFTASEIDRLMQCSASAALLQVKTNTQAGQLGTSEHAKYLKSGGLPASCKLWLCGGDFKNAPKNAQDRFEASFEYNPSTGAGRYLGSNLERGYVLSGPGLTAGTADVWNWWIDGAGLHIRVADLKTGFMQMAGDLPEPWDAWQLRWLTLAIIAAIRPTSLPLASIKVAWFVPDDLGCLEIKEAHRPFTVEDLETFRVQLAELSHTIQQQAGSVWREGPWCARCPGFPMCQLKRGVIEKLGINLEGPITAKSIVELSRLKQTVKKLLEQADDIELRWIQSNGQLPTRPGYALGLQTIRRKSLAPDAIELAKLVVAKPPIKQSLDLAAFNDLPPDEYKATMVKLSEVGAIGISASQHVREMRVKDE